MISVFFAVIFLSGVSAQVEITENAGSLHINTASKASAPLVVNGVDVIGMLRRVNRLTMADTSTFNDPTVLSPGGRKWMGGVLYNGNQIFCIPYDATRVLVIDTENNTLSTFGNLSDSSAKWAGGALGHDGYIYGIPRFASGILKIDPKTKQVISTSFREVDIPAHRGKNSWFGAVHTFDDRICSIPDLAIHVFCYSTIDKVFSTFPIERSTDQQGWMGGVLAPDNTIFAVPGNATSVLAILKTGEISFLGSLPATPNKWHGGVLVNNRYAYMFPHEADSVLIVDTGSRELNHTAIKGLPGGRAWMNGVLAPNGKIYGIPYASPTILIIDPSTDTATFDIPVRQSPGLYGKWSDGVLADNGKIYGIPFNSNSVLILDPSLDT
eukprot:gene3221-8237_t